MYKRNEKGQAMVEVAIILAMIGLISVSGFKLLGTTIGQRFDSAANSLDDGAELGNANGGGNAWSDTYTQPEEPEKDENGIYQITSVDELVWLRDYVNSGNSDASAILLSNLDLSSYCNKSNGVSWEPIGKDESKPYRGEFDGNGNVIKNLYLSNAVYAGIFGVQGDGEVKNLSVTGVDITGSYFVGGIVGLQKSGGSVESCTSTGSVVGKSAEYSYCGGIVGKQYFGGSVLNCMNECSVEPSAGSYSRSGGIVGEQAEGGKVINCLSTGEVKASSGSGNTLRGGIVGNSWRSSGTRPTIMDSYYLCTATINSTVSVVGNNGVQLTNCGAESTREALLAHWD